MSKAWEEATQEEKEAATKYAEDYARFLGVPKKDVKNLENRYLNGLEEFAQDVEAGSKA